MSRIRILPESVANKIAAGEVVERPASVVKELLENALDAGGKTVRIEVEQGGKRMIRVTDDGHGMTHDDALLAFERHATSKLKTADDLLSIATLGFRGEALPSIAAVSRLLLETRDESEPEGTRVEFAGGKLLGVKPAGLPAGTTVSVADIFYCVPARRKFLKSDTTELGHIASLVTHYALANPSRQFILSTPTQEVINCAPAEKLADRVYQLFGRQGLDELVEIPLVSAPFRAAVTEAQLDPEEERASLTVAGFTSRPEVQRLNRNGIYIFVNRRLVRDRLILHAIHEAYRNILPPTVFPATLPRPEQIADLKPLGQVNSSFIVAVNGEGLWIVDQHVAHERVLFEQHLEARRAGKVKAQRMLMPLVIELSPRQIVTFDKIAEELAANGFEAEPMGPKSVAIQAVPAGVGAPDAEKLLTEILDGIERENAAISIETLQAKIAASTACHAAIKVNMPLDQTKMEWLLAELAKTDCPMSCPHGRPVVLRYSVKEIERAFHRV